jgi:uncharacterized lipoprotein YmbA
MTPRRSALAWLGTLALPPGLAGCASSAAPAWHSLLPPAPPAAEAHAAPLVLAVGRVWLPEEVDRPQLVLHPGPGSVTLLDNERWSEPLKAQLPRALALGLAQRLPAAQVSAYPAAPALPPAWRLTLEVQRFELHAGAMPQALLQLLWVWQPGSAAGSRAAGALTLRQPAAAATPAALTAAMAQLLQTLCDEMARALCAVAGC